MNYTIVDIKILEKLNKIDNKMNNYNNKIYDIDKKIDKLSNYIKLIYYNLIFNAEKNCEKTVKNEDE